MTKAVWTGAVTAAAVLFLSSPVFAANTDTATVQVNVTVNARAKLTLGGTGSSTSRMPIPIFKPRSARLRFPSM